MRTNDFQQTAKDIAKTWNKWRINHEVGLPIFRDQLRKELLSIDPELKYVDMSISWMVAGGRMKQTGDRKHGFLLSLNSPEEPIYMILFYNALKENSSKRKKRYENILPTATNLLTKQDIIKSVHGLQISINELYTEDDILNYFVNNNDYLLIKR